MRKKRLIELESDGCLTDKVVNLLQRYMSNQDAGRAFVANKLGLSEKALQRKLAEEGATFSRAL